MSVQNTFNQSAFTLFGMANLIERGDNPDLTEERRKATFSVHQMASLLYGGEDKLQRREEIAKFVENAPDLQDPKPVEFMTRSERVENAARKVSIAPVAGIQHNVCHFRLWKWSNTLTKSTPVMWEKLPTTKSAVDSTSMSLGIDHK